MLLHSGPLGLAHCQRHVEPLPFGCVSSEDRELMQLETVLESSPRVWTPSFGNFTIYSSPQVMLVHLAANVIPLGLRVARQEVPQKLLRLGDGLVMSLLDFLEHLLGLPNLQLAGLHFSLGIAPLAPTVFWRFSSILASLSTALASFLHCMLSPFWFMAQRIATTCTRYSLVFPWEKMDMLKMVPSGSLILRHSGAS